MRWIVLLGLAACTGDGEEDTTDPTVDAIEGWSAIGTAELDDALESFQILDARSQGAYDAGHIPGALHLPSGDLRGTVDGVGGQAISSDEAEAALTDAGFNADLPTVVYGDENDTTTGRLFWSLAYYGATTGLRLLDGGMSAWDDAGLEVTTEDTLFQAPSWTGDATRDAIRVDKQWMLDHLDDTDVAFYDVRSASEYSAGHVPGAINVEWTENLDGDGFFRANTEVLELHGNPDASTVVVYCQSGARASVSWSVLTFTDLADVRLYDGSWNEWGADADTPKNTGSEP